jgi:hypothetical protein
MRKSLVTLAIAAGTVTAVGAGTAGYAIATNTAVNERPVAAVHVVKPTPKAKADPKPRHHRPRVKIVYVQPAAPASAPAPANPQMTNASAVVMQFYQDLSNHDYADAWSLGGDNIGGSDYNGWAAGYATTASITVTSYGTWNDGTVWADISAVQTDGTTRTYSGTYTVANGAIISANITQTS